MITGVKLAIALALLGACGKQAKPPASDDAAVGKAVADAKAVAADSVTTADAATAAIDAGLAGREPPTAESVHVEVGHAVARWMQDPRDRSLYAKDFEGRREPDGRVPFVGLDEWLANEPAKPQLYTSAVKTWLDPGSTLPEGESQTHVSFTYDDKDDYRELTFRREDGRQRLAKINTNSRNRARDKWTRWRNFFALEAATLGKTLTAWIRVEGDLVWLVVSNDKGAQVVADLWPDAATCAAIDPPEGAPKGTLARVRCSSGEGQDFTVVRDKDELVVRLTPAGKESPMSTDRTIKLARGAKLTFQPAR